MKLNTDKCHLLTSGSKFKQMWVEIGEEKVWKNSYVKLLEVKN